MLKILSANLLFDLYFHYLCAWNILSTNVHKQGNLTCKNCRTSLKCLFMEELLEESLDYQSAMLYNTMLRGVMFDALYKVGNGWKKRRIKMYC